MKIYVKQVKKHEEVWAEDFEWGESKVKICQGNSNFGRLYVVTDPDDGRGMFLDEEETAEVYKLLKEIWIKKKNDNPFGN